MVLGFSKGPTQSGALAGTPHDQIGFKGGSTALAKILHHISLLATPSSKLVDAAIADRHGAMHFGSLIRCTVERWDEKEQGWKGTGGGMLDRFLEHEREAIAAWAVLGYKRLLDMGTFTTPTSHLALLEDMAADNNSVRHFLTSPGTGLVWSEKKKIALPELHTQYWLFMLATGGSARVNISKFTKLMKELAGNLPFHIEIEGRNEIYYYGVGM